MSVAIDKIEGVKSVDVSLNEGSAKIQLEPGNKVTMDRLRKLVQDNGFTPREARVLVRGEVVSASGNLHLKVTGLEQAYHLSTAPKSKKTPAQVKAQAGKLLQVEGIIPPPQKDKVPILEILDVKPVE